MPWNASDARGFTKKAASPALQRLWAKVANRALRTGSSEASAIRQANQAVANRSAGLRRKT